MKHWNWEDCNDDIKRRVATAINAETAGRDTKPERNEQGPLGDPCESADGMVNIDGSVRVRIIRRYSGRSREYDDDNYIGGAKSIRDAITAFLGFKGDSKKDGIEFSYAQEKAEVTETVIEIYSKKIIKLA